jgi:hypothetical protein
LEFGNANRGIVLPWVTSAAAVTGAVDGTFIYDTSDKKVKYRNNGSWVDLSVDTTGVADTTLQDSKTENSGAKVAIGSTGATDTTPGILVLTDINKAMVLPKMVSPHLNIINPSAGMMAYDTNKKHLAVFNGTVWTFWKPTRISSLNCAGAINTGILTSGVLASGVSSQIPYTANGGSYGGQSVNSTGVTGLTANLSAGTFANGPGTLNYTITGTPSGSGTASFDINIGGQSCTLIRTVNAAFPADLVLAQNRMYFIGSVNDSDYLPFTAPSSAASLTPVNADGSTNTNSVELPVNVQGSLTTTGVTIRIPIVQSTSAGTLPAYSYTVNVPAQYTEDGISRDVVFSWTSQSYPAVTIGSTPNQYITATIATTSGTLNLKKLDLNSGIGSDYLGILVGELVYPYSSSATSTVELRDHPGIPDKMIGLADNAGSRSTHRFLYLPVQAEDIAGNIWLNNNLGAGYSTIGSSSFAPFTQAATNDDFNAYGSLFQWGRAADGHELMNFSSATSGASVYSITSGPVSTDIPATPDFISTGGANWTTTNTATLWGINQPNNPCPSGFTVPTGNGATSQLRKVFDELGGNNNITNATGSSLRIPTSLWRGLNGLTSSVQFNLWSSNSASANNAVALNSSGGASRVKTQGYPVRCIKN